ncbi:MAG: hypothetical protein M3356_01005, partial [Actinomycetota bacterium]|nr:hypothetical protein [Actinomycetota bacterium]
RRGQAAPARPATPRSRTASPSSDERPPPLWGAFPLSELIVLAGLVLMGWGFLQGVGDEGNSKVAAGLAIASIAGLELSVREHVTGFRSHTTLLAGAVAIAAIVVAGLVIAVKTLGVLLITGLVVFGGSFYGLRELFKRKSGGLSFR